MIYLFFFIIGVVCGSFINALEYRLYKNIPIWKSAGKNVARSKCPHCNTQLRALDLIPVVSFLLLQGRCRYCKKKISWQYPIVELITGLLFLLTALEYGLTQQTVLVCIAIVFLLCLFLYDFKYQLIPDSVVVIAILFAVPIGLLLGHSFQSMIVGMIIAGGFFTFQWIISNGKWIGGGDIQLGLLMGLLLGWEYTLLALCIAYIVGAIVGIVLLKKKQLTRSSHIAFGPFLMGSTLFCLLYGDIVLQAYISVLR